MQKSVVLLLDALSGIGRVAALGFARQGHSVVVSGRNAEAGAHLAEEIRSLGSEVEFVCARQEDDVDHLIHFTIERFRRVDAVFDMRVRQASLAR